MTSFDDHQAMDDVVPNPTEDEQESAFHENEHIISTRHLYVPMRDLVMIVIFVISIMSAWGLYSSKISDMQTQIDSSRKAIDQLVISNHELKTQQTADELYISDIKTALTIKFPSVQFPAIQQPMVPTNN